MTEEFIKTKWMSFSVFFGFDECCLLNMNFRNSLNWALQGFFRNWKHVKMFRILKMRLWHCDQCWRRYLHVDGSKLDGNKVKLKLFLSACLMQAAGAILYSFNFKNALHNVCVSVATLPPYKTRPDLRESHMWHRSGLRGSRSPDIRPALSLSVTLDRAPWIDIVLVAMIDTVDFVWSSLFCTICLIFSFYWFVTSYK